MQPKTLRQESLLRTYSRLPGLTKNGEYFMKQTIPVLVRKFPLRMAMALAAVVMLVFAVRPVSAQSVANAGSGLRELIELEHATPGLNLKNAETKLRVTGGKKATGVFRLHVDAQNRVLTNVYADGSVSLASVKNLINGAGGSVVAVDSAYSNGVISAYLPLAGAGKLAHAPGVSSLHLAHRAVTHVGLVTSQGAVVLRSDLANKRGFNRDRITVRILSH